MLLAQLGNCPLCQFAVPTMILAGDIGGTKTLIGLFEQRAGRPVPIHVESFPTTEYAGLGEIIDDFLADERPRVSVAAFGVAGPVLDQTALMTNVEWQVEAAELVGRFNYRHVRLLNDLEAMAYSVPVLAGDELTSLQTGTARPDGNIALIAAGTGLGGALLHRLDDRYVPVASEIGHGDFAARTDRELEFVRFVRARHGRCEIEHLLCGPGLVNLAKFTHRNTQCASLSHADAAAKVSTAALAHSCPCCTEAVEMFVDAYGAVAGNLALIGVTTGGVFLGGGIAPRILPALESGRFTAAFRDKPPMDHLLTAMPINVILNADAGLIGAAVYANAMSLAG
jgi:glucokinase